MHGTFEDRSSFVLTRRDYERTEDTFVAFVLDLVDRGVVYVLGLFNVFSLISCLWEQRER